MDAVILFAITVVIVNLAFVVIPARELRDLLLPPRHTSPAPPHEARPQVPMAPATPTAVRDVSWRVDRVSAAPARGRVVGQTIVLRSTLPAGVSSDVAQVAIGA